MTIMMTVSYPSATPQPHFDLTYYKQNHMPLVESKWSKHGLKSWRVVVPAAEDADSTRYCVEAITYWESREGVERAFAEDADEVMADIEKFTDLKPIRRILEVVAESK